MCEDVINNLPSVDVGTGVYDACEKRVTAQEFKELQWPHCNAVGNAIHAMQVMIWVEDELLVGYELNAGMKKQPRFYLNYREAGLTKFDMNGLQLKPSAVTNATCSNGLSIEPRHEGDVLLLSPGLFRSEVKKHRLQL